MKSLFQKHALGVVYSPSKAPQSHPGPWQTIKDEEGVSIVLLKDANMSDGRCIYEPMRATCTDEDITYLGERSRSEAVDAEDVEMILLGMYCYDLSNQLRARSLTWFQMNLKRMTLRLPARQLPKCS